MLNHTYIVSVAIRRYGNRPDWLTKRQGKGNDITISFADWGKGQYVFKDEDIKKILSNTKDLQEFIIEYDKQFSKESENEQHRQTS